jgi:LPXTG-motif cell wall-anchored protein
MGETGDAVSYTLIALGFVLLIFLGALFFVQASRRGNVRFKWGRRRAEGEQRGREGVSSRGP